MKHLLDSKSAEAGHLARIKKFQDRADWAKLNFLRGLRNNELPAFAFLGWLQSDGCFSLGCWVLYFAPKDMQYYDYLKETGTQYMGWPPNERTRYSENGCRIEELHWNSIFLWPLGQILRRPELPRFLWRANDECKIHFLRWYDLGDGRRAKKDHYRHYLGTSEPQRAIDLSNLALSVGLVSEHKIRDDLTPAGNPTYLCEARIYFKEPFVFCKQMKWTKQVGSVIKL